MPTIFEITDAALSTLSPAVPYAMDEMLGQLPDQYIIYTLITGVGVQHADNDETARSYRVQLSIMSRDDLVNLPNVDAAMIAAGFKKGPERQIAKDPSTSHFGLAVDYFYMTQ